MFAPNPTTAAVDNEPLMSAAICAELDNAPLKIPLNSFAVIVALELISPLAVICPPAEILNLSSPEV